MTKLPSTIRYFVSAFDYDILATVFQVFEKWLEDHLNPTLTAQDIPKIPKGVKTAKYFLLSKLHAFHLKYV